MLTQGKFAQLIKGELPDEAARELLMQMQPDNVSAQQFAELLDEMLDTADHRFQLLERYATSSMDCCGTGGSGLPRFNTSTAVSFVVAAAGVKVAKFGNRAASSKSGSFDVLGCLGIPASVTAEKAARLLDECNLVFLFAPDVYPVLSRLSQVRKSIATTTVFNFIGPLLNPVKPYRRLLGVSNAHMVSTIEAALRTKLKTDLAVVVRSQCGLDEICSGCQVNSVVVAADAVPPDFQGTLSLSKQKNADCQVHFKGQDRTPPSPEINARLMISLFDGEATDSDAYFLVCLNAAAALLVAGRVSSLCDGEALAGELLSSGKVRTVLNNLVAAYEKR